MDTRNFRHEASQILAGTSRFLPDRRHLEALERVIQSQDAAIKELQATLSQVIENAAMVDRQL